MDVLLLATRCQRKPWFLTRSDVFSNSLLRALFSFLQMIPIYRIRDGKENLSKNHAVFARCSDLMANNESLLLFPEANHNLKRRVRPLSKGFTRIIDRTLEERPNLVLQLVPVGQNYQNPTQIGDSASVHFGKPIGVSSDQYGTNSIHLKKVVSTALKKLTTHIDDEENYALILDQMDSVGVDYLNPTKVNKMLRNNKFVKNNKILGISRGPNRFLFYLLNLPQVFIWRVMVKPRVPEPEFMATFRFGFSMICYPLFYVLLFMVISKSFGLLSAFFVVLGHFALNIVLIKVIGITSSDQRK